jgi:aconitase B
VVLVLVLGTGDWVDGQTEYEKHVAERAAMGVVPTPINAAQMAELAKLLEDPPAGEEQMLLDLITNRVPPGVDEAAYVKADFLTAIVKGQSSSSSSSFPPCLLHVLTLAVVCGLVNPWCLQTPRT